MASNRVGFMVTMLVAVIMGQHANASSLGLVSSPLVDHPVHHPLDGRSGSVWRGRVGSWGENCVEQTLRLRGFNEIHEIKTGGNNGIDRVAIKRGANRAILDAKFVEVKASRSSKPHLGTTRYGGKQMSRLWLSENLKSMHRSGDPAIKKLALELSRFRKASGLPIESLGELVHLNTQSGRISGYAADGRALKYSRSMERMLTRIQKRAGSQQARAWATLSLSQLDQIQSTNMSSWLGRDVVQRSQTAVLSSSSRGVGAARIGILKQPRALVARKLLQRSAGPIAVVAAFAFDAKELFDTEYAYRSGGISVRQRNVRVVTTLGGMAGAFGGASAGGAAGLWLGAFGGPVAWITVPTGGFLGATIGGIGGYFGGSAIAGYGATAWYDSIDASVRDKFELVWLATNAPLF